MASEASKVRAERIGLNESAFRRANELIRDRAEDLERRKDVPFICECGDERCLVRVELSLEEYEEVRRGATHFLVAPGHEITGPDLGRILRSGTRYSVVEKIGIAGKVAQQRATREASEEAK